MAGYRYWLQCSIAIGVALTVVSLGQAYEPVTKAATSQPLTCKVYSLADLGDDAKMCKWVAETIPEMIQPSSWKNSEARLSYFAPSRILVVNNTPAVHAQVEEFLQGVRKTVVAQKASIKQDAQVVPAQFALQDASRPTGPGVACSPPSPGVTSGPAGYPVPMAPVGPKHLFHFIIRYEGEGIIDSNVAKFTESLAKQAAAASQSNYTFPPPAPMGDPLVPASSNAITRGMNPPAMPLADAPPSPVPPPPALPVSPFPQPDVRPPL
jgi:hypothetical protein